MCCWFFCAPPLGSPHKLSGILKMVLTWPHCLKSHHDFENGVTPLGKQKRKHCAKESTRQVTWAARVEKTGWDRFCRYCVSTPLPPPPVPFPPWDTTLVGFCLPIKGFTFLVYFEINFAKGVYIHLFVLFVMPHCFSEWFAFIRLTSQVHLQTHFWPLTAWAFNFASKTSLPT